MPSTGAHSVAARPRLSKSKPELGAESFLEGNVCGRALLTIVARGDAIITELHRLIDLVPAPYKHAGELSPNFVATFMDRDKQFTLNDIVCDFNYFKIADAFEAKIESNETLKRADEDFCDNFLDIITRFYLTFESVQRYAQDLKNFMNDLDEDVFIGQTLDSLLVDTEARQLLCEAYFLLGYMLLTVDQNFEGGLRERLIVSYYRYSSQKSSPESNLDETCNLLRTTGYKTPQQQIYGSISHQKYHRPEGYPENLFGRANVNQSVINLLIAKLQSVDIYNQTVLAFPHPDHRSAALAQQASMLFVILFFCPSILRSQRARMREITDKFFYDNWVTSLYMGELVNLIEAWEPYKAARESLIQMLEFESTKNLANQYHVRFNRASVQLHDCMREGWLDRQTVLTHQTRILNTIREANVVLKWTLLHGQSRPNWDLKLAKLAHSTVIEALPKSDTMYRFLQDLAELEKRFIAIYSELVSLKSEEIQENKDRASETLAELIDIYSDARPMRWIQAGANLKLAELLAVLRSDLQVVDLDQVNSRDSIINLISQIDAVQESYSDGKNLQVTQLFKDTRDSLSQILRSLGLNGDVLSTIHSISDFSYAWRIMDDSFTNQMQQIIKEDPLKVYGIKSVFLKYASAFDSHLIRIQQINAKTDLISVSQYYSSKIVTYIRDVLHIIPATILELMSLIVSIQTEDAISNMPSKIQLDNLKDFALPDKRFKMLELTYKVSHYAESLLTMEDTTIGLIQINSRQLLEDGLRRELVLRMSDSIQKILTFDETKTPSNTSDIVNVANAFIAKLKELDVIMKGYMSSFEYIQDYLVIYGLRLCQEELTRIIRSNVDQAIRVLLKENQLQEGMYIAPNDAQTLLNQTTRIPVPVYSSDPLESSFIVRLLSEILRITDPRSTIFDEQMSAWYDQKAQRNKVADLKIFELTASSLSAAGLNGLDTVCCALSMLELQKLDNLLISIAASHRGHEIQALLEPTTVLVESNHSQSSVDPSTKINKQPHSGRIYAPALNKLRPYSERILSSLLRIGQLQSIRVSISCVLSTKCRHEARNLYDCLETLNTTLISSLRHGKGSSQQIKEKSTDFSVDDTVNGCSGRDLGEPCNDIDGGIDERSDTLEESQLIFELTNHLDWIGLSDPMSKIYTLSLQASDSSQVYEFREQHTAMGLMFLILLDQCSKFHFSRSISGFVPKQSKSFYGTSSTVDGQPFFYGLITLINHYQPFLSMADGNKGSQCLPLNRLLLLMSLYVKRRLNEQADGGPMKPQNLTLETGNMILSMIELVRLARQPLDELLSQAYLPPFILETFQFTVCHLNRDSGTNSTD